MEDHNKIISDNELHDLLRRRLLEQGMEDDELTQKLTDMEAKLVFGDKALYVPSPQKEKTLFNEMDTKRPGMKYPSIYKSGLVLIILAILFGWFLRRGQHETVTDQKQPERKTNPAASLTFPPVHITTTESLRQKPLLDPLTQTVIPVNDTAEQKAEHEKGTIPGDFVHPPLPKEKSLNVEDIAVENIPVLGSKEIDANNKRKNNLVKDLLKKNKRSWVYIPASSAIVNGKTVSVNGFYASSAEITNIIYKTFLEDLLIQGRTEDYLKAVPDTVKWVSAGKEYFLSLNNDTNLWNANGLPFFEPMRKNYWWHPAYDNYPVVNVSRQGAKMFCDWLTMAVNDKIKRDNLKVNAADLYMNDLRLPSEAEWVIAARGGDTDVDYPWSYTGVNIPQNAKGCYLANFCIRQYKSDLKCDAIRFPNAYTSAGTFSHDYSSVCPVNSYNPNKFGLYNISGNVAEMVWEDETKAALTKGGSWNSDAEHIKINAREHEKETEGSPFIGFRPVFTFKDVKK